MKVIKYLRSENIAPFLIFYKKYDIIYIIYKIKRSIFIVLINLYFGDYYDDGHGHYYHTCVEASSEKLVVEAKEKIEKNYPEFFK